MKPGERVDLIKKLADSLAETTWQHVDLVLRQFGFPWSREWDGGDLQFYAQHHLEQGKTPEGIATALFDILIDHSLTAGEMATAVVNYFAASTSYSETRRRVVMVERIKVWTPELLQRVETATRENDEIQNCFDMPDRIRALVRRHSGRE
jgi:hypothetical protein